MNDFYGIDESKIREYARLAVRAGVNVQPGQKVVVRCEAQHYAFARMIAEEAYTAGAGEVVMKYSDTVCTRLYYENVSDEVLTEVPDWMGESMNYYAREKAAFISVSGSNPEAYKGLDPKRLQTRSNLLQTAQKEFRDATMMSLVPWTIIAVPQEDWAKKVFPDLSEEDAMRRLWEYILKTVRIGDGDAVKAWEEHVAFLQKKCCLMNSYAFEKLHYKNSLGTDFTVGLAKGHIWEGGSEKAGTGVTFLANMPTEEIFTMPDCRVAEGTLVSALPLSLKGTLVKNFKLTFHEGCVTDCAAEEGEEALKALLETDEGSRRLGEVAFVPYGSPISAMKTLFYNTLFDENASCHFALGRCYPTTVAGGENMSEAELSAVGGNFSVNHVDFMVGTSDLAITGILADGSEVEVFRDGVWAI
ncbi:MAG: aminopeptidase [Lachnospiraceae bacterium]|nr:aminopeptidase [Lachnospiraceae bacterium]